MRNGDILLLHYQITSIALLAASLYGQSSEPVPVLINEIQASNHETLMDEDGDFPDWIELYNAGSEPVFLEGFGLSDSESNPYKWVLPDVVIEADQFLLIFASGKERVEGLHL